MNPTLKQMPLWRDANRLLLLIEDAVRQFSRYHKYTLGSDLRKQAFDNACACRIHCAPTPPESTYFIPNVFIGNPLLQTMV